MYPISPRGGRAIRRPLAGFLAAAALVFLVVHALSMPQSLEDLDSINLALGVRSFDVSLHQPHPPGYPVFIALTRLSTAAFRAAGSPFAEARGLAVFGVLGGSLAVFLLFAVFREIGQRDVPAALAAVTVVCSPLFWVTADRPLTDTAGLTMALGAQALTLAAWRRQRSPAAGEAGGGRLLLWAAASAGLAIGVRSQTFLLTLPLGIWVTLDPRVPAARRMPWRVAAAFAAGVAAWAIPLVAASGGPAGYLRALAEQASQDFSGVVMLATHPSPRVAMVALRETFLNPWALAWLGPAMLGLAAAGALVLLRRSWTATWALALMTVPYAVFHLLFQESATVRYALPLVPPVAFLAVLALDAAAGLVARRGRGSRLVLLSAACGAVVAASLWTAVPVLRIYAAAPSPVFRALADMTARAASDPANRPALVVHAAARRSVEWTDPSGVMDVLQFRPSYEWLAAVQYWLDGGRDPVWFLARPVRTDLALIDPRHLTLAAQYRWPFETAVFTGGARPAGVDWYVVERPAWFLDKGWALTPETAGVAARAGDGPNTGGSVAHLARTSAEMTVMIGGRQLGQSDDQARITAAIDGRVVLEWTQPPGAFLKFQTLPAGTLEGPGDFARLVVTAAPAGGAAGAPVSLEQFDLAPRARFVWGYGDGWMEPEFDTSAKRVLRWSSGRSVLRVTPPGRDLTVRLVGEAPVDQIGRVPSVSVSVGGTLVDTFEPAGAFEREVTVPDDALRQAEGRVVLETRDTFVPNERLGNGDRRRLSLKIYRVVVGERAPR